MKEPNQLSSVDLFRSLHTHRFYEQASPPIIVTDSLRTPENMGAVLRLAGNIGALKTLFVASNPPDFKTYKIKRTASGAFEKCDWKIIPPEDLLKNLPDDYQIVALETSSDAQSIYKTNLPHKMVMIVGNEMHGISKQLMDIAQQQVYIPLPGKLYSLNVTHALSVGLFEWYRQIAQH